MLDSSFGWASQTLQEASGISYGSLESVVAALTGHLAANDCIADGRFTAAGVYLESQVGWGLQFGTLPANPVLQANWARLKDRPARRAAEAKDTALLPPRP